MLNQVRLIRNVGPFDSVAGTPGTELARLTLIYAENGRGKTTLSAILRSLQSGSSVPVKERHRLGAEQAPHVVIDCDGNPQPATLENDTWSRTYPAICVFDDIFVHENVHSGLDVTAEHRQNLHQVIIGRQGVSLAREVENLASEITRLQGVVRENTTAISTDVRGTFSVDEFCALSPVEGLAGALADAERRLAALRQSQAVATTEPFQPLEPPSIDVDELQAVIARDLPQLDTTAATAVQDHFAQLGDGAESWVERGMRYASATGDPSTQPCPFCTQTLRESDILSHYRAYFSDAYADHHRSITEIMSNVDRILGGDSLAAFQQRLTQQIDRHRFWAQFHELQAIDLDPQQIAESWQHARDQLLRLARAKQATPLEIIDFDEAARTAVEQYEGIRQQCRDLSRTLLASNNAITTTKEAAAEGDAAVASRDLERLKRVQSRFSDAVRPLCDEYLAAQTSKAEAERRKVEAREALDRHRATIFPRYQATINEYLAKFYAGFRIVEVQATNPRGTPSSVYQIEINNCQVPIASANANEPTPTFKNTLSAGDRNALALAFFFAALDQEPDLATTVVVIDDPVSSLDDGRTLTTAQELRALAAGVEQVILLSHSKQILCMVWEHCDQENAAALEIVRAADGSSIEQWAVHDAAITEYDRRHALLRGFVGATHRDGRQVAISLRPVLEAYLRVACSEYFPPGTLLGPFINRARQLAENSRPILPGRDLAELDAIKEYANRFHHDSNPAWDVAVNNINETELLGFAGRTVTFTTRQ